MLFRVKNKKTVRRLAIRSMKADRVRNIIAVFAIILTTVLFTGVFSILSSVNASFQQETFREVGGDFHASIKNITGEQLEDFAADSAIKSSGRRLFLGMPYKSPFDKEHVEVSYMDERCATGYFCIPEEGTLPKEGTNQFATDTKVLKLLGAAAKLGEKIEFSYYLDDGTEISDTFELSGWWEADEASRASMMIVPESYCEKVLADYQIKDSESTGKWDLDIMFSNSFQIAKKLDKLVARHGYNEEKGSNGYVSTGVNWGYTSERFLNSYDVLTMVEIAVLLIFILLTGYLIIYNIFRISVSNDIRYYGLLKTIGVTGKQIKKMIHLQLLWLSMIGIPIGLLIGFIIGNGFVPMIMTTLSYQKVSVSVSPLLFISAAAFSLFTVWMSCKKPGKMAGKVSPIEAVRYTEQGMKRKKKKKSYGAKLYKMALANLGRSKSKTFLVVTSLTLSIFIFNITISLAKGFDLDKFVGAFCSADFIVAGKEYFRTTGPGFTADSAVSEELTADLEQMEGIEESGRIYGQTVYARSWFSKERLRAWQKYWDPEMTDELFSKRLERHGDKNADGLYAESIQLYGMEDMPLQYLTVMEGDVTKVNDGTDKYIIAVVLTDDYGNPVEGLDWYQLGDEVVITYGEAVTYIDSRTGEPASELTPYEYFKEQPTGDTWERTYTVCAKVSIPYSLSYRHYGENEFILGGDTFVKDTGTDSVMSFLMDASKEKNDAINRALENYTTTAVFDCDFESKEGYKENFKSFRNVFAILGVSLSFIVGLIGVLNFFNAVFTGIHTRKRELAMLQAVGMTGEQLKRMLIYEGLFYTVSAVCAALLLCGTIEVFILQAITNVSWFFTCKVTLLPIFIIVPVFAGIGFGIPVILYHSMVKKPVVERLHIAE
ncbi:MAG: ABC transporter permease [Lachnospiraceae bacterium]|nr:ABC transporter permease [Lachnospiraceae bacterium]